MPDQKSDTRFRILTCDCQGTSPLDQKSIEAAAGRALDFCGTQLCRKQIDVFKDALKGGAPVLVGCTQEAPLFLEVADEAGSGNDLRFFNIREKAGWSAESGEAGGKMGALLAEAMLNIEGPLSVSMTSNGAVLVIGHDEAALEAAQRLAGRMDVTLLFTGDPDVTPPRIADVPIFHGKPMHARGHLGAFEVEIGNFAPAVPAAREQVAFEPVAAERSRSKCDIVLDLRGDTPLVQAPAKRDGYFNPDPKDPAAVARALFDISGLVGEFEKPIYVEYKQEICAHSRNGIDACSRCLDNCPTGAITPNGDGVAIDAYICAGCGNCASVCPTGAVRYRMPESEQLLLRLRTLLKAYAGVRGGKRPVLLVHDGEFGEEMISMIARHYDGLPANVIPVAVNAVSQCGLEMLTAARVYGAAGMLILAGRNIADDLAGLNEAAELTNKVLSALGYRDGKIEIIREDDPEKVAQLIRAAAKNPPEGPQPEAFSPYGGKRELLSLSLTALYRAAPTPVDEIALEKGAPFGTIEVDVENCTLCLACTGVCPTEAVRDNPDHPQLSFVEMNCVQCGLCENTCPEDVISLRPRLNFTDAAREARIIKEEQPFECVRCGKPFATRSTVEAVQQRLTNHSMFPDPASLRRIQMCAECRVIDLAESGDDPFKSKPRQITRTTEDYLRARELGIVEDDD